MKINKTLIILSLLLIFCISLGAVSAADNTDISVDINNDVATVESSVMNEEINGVNEDSVVYIANEEPVVYIAKDGDDLNPGTFDKPVATLDKALTIVKVNGNIVFKEGTYILNDVKINKDVHINSTDGKAILSGNNENRILTISSNVVISNLTFANGKSNNGGAIYGWGSVSGCSFVNCSSESGEGGAIYGWGSVSGCSFVNCNANYRGRGGAIYSIGDDCVVSGCSFVGCSAYYGGGAIFFHEENSVVVNCSFVNCSSENGNGGAIFFEENGSVTYCIFENNTGNGNCNAIYVDKAWLDADYNFFGFQNNVTKFPNDLIWKLNDSYNIESIIPNYWVILNITNSSNDYFIGFVLNDGSSLSANMMDYNVILTINDTDAKEITIRNNSFNDTYIHNSVYKVNSCNTGKLIASAKFGYVEDSFTTLNELITNRKDNTITLNQDYKFYNHWDDDFKEGIIIEDNVIIEGNGITIDGCGVSKVFRITGENVTIKGINFINARCTSEGGAIYWSGNNGVVSGCSFTNCYTRNEGGAIFFEENVSVVNCSFMKCTAFHQGGAIYGNSCNDCSIRNCIFVGCKSNGFAGAIHLVSANNCSINYCVFEGNSAYDIYVKSGTVNADFNFFGFQNNVTSFPKGLVYGVTLNSWVVLNITNSSNNYFIDFVLNNGSKLSASMMDYNVILTINDNDAKEITIRNNSFNDTYVKGHYLLTSLNTNKVLVNITFGIFDYNITTTDCDYGGTATVVVIVPTDVTGNFTITVDDGQVLTEIIKNGYVNISINGLSVGVHNLNISYSGDETYIPFNTSATVTVFGIPEFDIDVNASGIYGDCVNGSINETYNGTITFTIEGNNFTGNVVDGNFSVDIKGIGANTYADVPVRFVSDDGGFIGNAVINLTIIPKNIDLNGFIYNAYFGTNLTGILVTGGKTGNVSITVGGVVYTGFVDWEGHFVINNTDSLTAGNYDNVVLDFVSDDGNYAGNMTVSFIIMDVPTIDDVVVSGNYSETVSFNMTVHNAQSGDIVVLHLLNGSNITGNLYVVDGVVEFTTVLPFACEEITDVFYIRNNVVFDSAVVSWNISKISTNIIFEPENVTTFIGDENTVNVTVFDVYGNPVKEGKINVSGEGVTLLNSNNGIYNLVDGKATIMFSYNVSGNYKLNVTYLGGVATNNTDNYYTSSKLLDVSVSDINLNTYIVSDYADGKFSFDGKYGEQLTFNFTVYDERGLLVDDGNLTIWFNGKAYTKEVVNGHVSITNEDFVLMNTGLYAYVVEYMSASDMYKKSFNFTSVSIPKVETQITINGTVNDESVKEGKVTLTINVTDVNKDVIVNKGIIYYVTPDGIRHSVNITNGTANVVVEVNRTGKYEIAVSYVDLDGDFLYSSNSFTWSIQKTTTLISVSKNGEDIIATINVGDELGNTANGKVNLFYNGKLMNLNVVNGLVSVNLGTYNGPVEISAVFTGADGLTSYDNVIVEFVETPINAPDVEEIDSDLTDVKEFETAPDEVGDENDTAFDEGGVEGSSISGIPMQHTAIPILALILALLVLPLTYKRD